MSIKQRCAFFHIWGGLLLSVDWLVISFAFHWMISYILSRVNYACLVTVMRFRVLRNGRGSPYFIGTLCRDDSSICFLSIESECHSCCFILYVVWWLLLSSFRLAFFSATIDVRSAAKASTVHKDRTECSSLMSERRAGSFSCWLFFPVQSMFYVLLKGLNVTDIRHRIWC